jgi:nucleotide-binding universal stress UspA family protein
LSDAGKPARSVYVWVAEGTWPATVDAALQLAPEGAVFTLLHVSDPGAADAARGAYLGLFGRGGGDPGPELAELATASAGGLLAAAAGRLGRPCDRRALSGQAERVVVSASADADLLIVARDGDRARLGPKSLGRITRFVVDHAACPVLLVWPDTAPAVGTMPPPPPHHPHHRGH